MLGWSGAELEERLRGIGSTLREVFKRAEAEGITTQEAAEHIARARLDLGPQ